MDRVVEMARSLSPRKTTLLFLVLITFAVLLVYSNSFTADWHYDDFHHVKENINIRRLSNIPLFFQDSSTFSRNPNTKMYRPLLMATHALNYWYAVTTTRDGYDVRGYHVVNFLFHLASTFAIFWTTLFLFRKRINIEGLDPLLPATFAALLFGLHTINTETVVYISSRSAGMATMFFLWSFFLYLKATEDLEGARTSWHILAWSAFLYLCGFLTKEIAVTLPGMAFLYEVTLNRGWMEGKKPAEVARKIVFRLVPYGLVLLAILRIRLAVYGENLVERFLEKGGSQAAPHWVSQLATQVRATVFYLREWFLPTGLSIDKPFTVSRNFAETPVLLSIAVIAVIVMFSLRQIRRHPAISLGVLWFFIGLLPEALFRLNVIVNDHRLYLPGFGFVLVFTYVAAKLFVRFRKDGGWYFRSFGILCAFTILLMGLGTFKRNMAFATEESIWKDVILKDSKSVRGYNNLGIYYEQHGDLEKAIQFYLRTTKLAPFFPNPYINLGNVYHKKKEYDKAIDYMKQAIRLEPSSALAHYNMGNILREAGRIMEATESYKEALKFNPRYIEAANNLANIYFSEKNFSEAIQFYQKALQIDPTFAMSFYNIGLAYENLGKAREAKTAFTQFLRFWNGAEQYRSLAESRIQHLERLIGAE